MLIGVVNVLNLNVFTQGIKLKLWNLLKIYGFASQRRDVAGRGRNDGVFIAYLLCPPHAAVTFVSI